MEIIPAIDLRGGRCVRLYQGDYADETVFSRDPVEVALRWQSMGAPRLRVVDLDGAAMGEICNLEVIREIVQAALVPVELGGGIRNLNTVEQLLRIGVDRVVIGTAAVETPDLVKEACRRFSESVIIGVDAREGKLATHGWRQQTETTAAELIHSMIRLGARRFIYTDINRDGTLTEPNFTAISEVLSVTKLPVIAAGGIASLSHLKILAQLGVEGAIIGKALYTGDINLKQALNTINYLKGDRVE